MGDAHGIDTHTRVDADGAEHVAQVMTTLSAASRVRILSWLRDGSCTVTELVDGLGLAQPAVSQQLRVLRDAGLVSGTRRGRTVVYELFDPHVASLLDEALRHVAHVYPTVSHPRRGPHTHD